jgi:hypothetical protein
MAHAAPASRRTYAQAAFDALPDLGAALACAIAWIAPQALGFDLLMWAAPAYFVEFPLALLLTFAGVRRMSEGQLGRREKIRVVLVPALVLAALSGLLLGLEGLVALLWLGTLTIVRLLRGEAETSPTVRGAWLVYDRKERSFTMPEHKPAPRAGLIVVPAGHEQVMAAVTIGTFIWIPLSFLVLPAFGTGGATPAYAASVGWTDTAPGSLFPAHYCLAAGLILFTVRGLAHFEGVGEAPPARVEDDELLKDVIEKIEGRRPGGPKAPPANLPRRRKRGP